MKYRDRGDQQVVPKRFEPPFDVAPRVVQAWYRDWEERFAAHRPKDWRDSESHPYLCPLIPIRQTRYRHPCFLRFRQPREQLEWNSVQLER